MPTLAPPITRPPRTPKTTTSRANEATKFARFQSLEFLREQERIQRVWRRLHEAGLHPILVKGWSTGRLYPAPGERKCCDVDLCFPLDEIPRVLELQAEFPLDFILIDIHGGLPDLPGRSWEDVYARTREIPLADCAIRILGWEDHLRLTCHHLLRHGARSRKWLRDVAMIVNALPDDFDWDECLRGPRHEAEWVLTLVGVAQRLFDAQVQDERIRRLSHRVPNWLFNALPKIWEAGIDKHPLGYYFRNLAAAWQALCFRYLNGVRAAAEMGRVPQTRLGLAVSIAKFFVARRIPTLFRHPWERLKGNTRHDRAAEAKWVHY